MTEVQVNTTTLEVRTVKLTKSLLNQIQKAKRIPPGVLSPDGNIDPTKCVGWVHGSVLGDKFETLILFKLDSGDYQLYHYPGEGPRNSIKQIYIV